MLMLAVTVAVKQHSIVEYVIIVCMYCMYLYSTYIHKTDLVETTRQDKTYSILSFCNY